jgi:hypothetical protein
VQLARDRAILAPAAAQLLLVIFANSPWISEIEKNLQQVEAIAA